MFYKVLTTSFLAFFLNLPTVQKKLETGSFDWFGSARKTNLFNLKKCSEGMVDKNVLRGFRKKFWGWGCYRLQVHYLKPCELTFGTKRIFFNTSFYRIKFHIRVTFQPLIIFFRSFSITFKSFKKFFNHTYNF